jgi:ABC-type nitrate/sulfonate/bicarbonate transport system ATPase subunit
VFSKRPARIIKTLKIEYPRPRDRTSEECNNIRRDVLKILEEEMRRKGEGNENRRDIL